MQDPVPVFIVNGLATGRDDGIPRFVLAQCDIDTAAFRYKSLSRQSSHLAVADDKTWDAMKITNCLL
jgi:hypothetical protein